VPACLSIRTLRLPSMEEGSFVRSVKYSEVVEVEYIAQVPRAVQEALDKLSPALRSFVYLHRLFLCIHFCFLILLLYAFRSRMTRVFKK